MLPRGPQFECTSFQSSIPAADLQHRAANLRAAPGGAFRRDSMEIVGIVMLGSVALWFSQQFDRAGW